MNGVSTQNSYGSFHVDSEKEYHQIYQAAGLGIARVSLQGQWLEVNAKICELFQYSPEALMLKTFQEITHPDDLESDLQYVQQMLNREINSYSMEKRYIRKDGSIIWCKLSVTLVVDEQQVPKYFVSIIDDIDQQVQQRQSLIELKNQHEYDSNRYRNLLETSKNGIAIFNDRGEVVELNQAFAQMLGYTTHEMLGMQAWEWDPNMNREKIAKLQAQLLLAPKTFTTLHTRKDGSTYPAKVSANAFYLNDTLQVMSIAIDISEQVQFEKQLIAERDRAQLYLDMAGSIIVALDTSANITLMNQYGCEIFGLSEAEILGKNWFEYFIPEAQRQTVQTWFSELMAGKLTDRQFLENEIKSAKGDYFQIHWHNVLLRNAQGEIIGLLSSGQDMTEKNHLIQSLEEQNIRFEMAIEGSKEGLWDWDLVTDNAYHSKQFEQMLGYAGDELPQTSDAWKRLIHPNDQSQTFTKVEQYLKSKGLKVYENTFRMLTKSGDWRWIKGRGKAIFDKDGTPLRFIGFNADVTNQIEHQTQLDYASKHDPLTQLANRSLLDELLQNKLSQSDRSQKSLALIYLDLDGFKEINDQYRHKAGDEVLINVSRRMLEAIRQEDIVARLGGDEFVIVVSDLTLASDILPLLSRLLNDISQPIHEPTIEHPLKVNASIGVSLYPQTHPVDASALIRQADQAMYRSKDAGKNQYTFYDSEQNTKFINHLKVAESIACALHENRLQMYFQPSLNALTGEIVSVEALLRYKDQDGQLQEASSFIEFILGNQALLTELSEWVMQVVFQQLSLWKQQNFDFLLTLNVSTEEVQSEKWIDNLLSNLRLFSNIKAEDIELDINESAFNTNSKSLMSNLSRLKKTGFVIAMDQFGGPNSSIHNLQTFEIDTFKVTNDSSECIVKNLQNFTTFNMAQAIAQIGYKKLVAKNIETKAQAILVTKIGFLVLQGRFLAPEMSAKAITKWIKNHTATPIISANESHPLSQEERQFLTLNIQHLEWLRKFEAFVLGENVELPNLDESQCSLGTWLNKMPQADNVLNKSIRQLHHQIHDLAHQILITQYAGDATTHSDLKTLRSVSEQMMQHVSELLKI